MTPTKPLFSCAESYRRLLGFIARQALVLPLSFSVFFFSSILCAPGVLTHPLNGLLIFNPWFYAILAVLLILQTAGHFLLKKSWKTVGALYLATALTHTYLAWDEPLRHEVNLAVISPEQPGDKESYDLWMRFAGTGHIRKHSILFQKAYLDSNTADAALKEQLLKDREKILAEWEKAADLRAWIDQLNRFERIGDTGTTSYSSEEVRYLLWRNLVLLVSARARLFALEGDADRAIATLLPMIQVSRRIIPASRDSGRPVFLSNYGGRYLLNTIPFVLDNSQPSAGSLTSLKDELAKWPNPAAVLSQLYSCQLALSQPFWTRNDSFFENTHSIEGLFGPLLTNPNRTTNLLGDLNQKLEPLMARRDYEEMDRVMEAFEHQKTGVVFKNKFGLEYAWIPLGTRNIKNFWEAHDIRNALITRLEKMTAKP